MTDYNHIRQERIRGADFIAGISQIFTARHLPTDEPERRVILTDGVSVAIMGVLLVSWRGSGIALISSVNGIAVILTGISLIYLGSRFKRLEARMGARGNNKGAIERSTPTAREVPEPLTKMGDTESQ